jgi:hypothetical protein
MKSVRGQGIYVDSWAMFWAMNRALALHWIRLVLDCTFPFSDAVSAFRHLEPAWRASPRSSSGSGGRAR